MDQLASMRIFVAVAQERSLAKASRNLDLSPSAVSKHIAALESRLGVQLLARTTRKVALTEVGATYLEKCQKILHDIDLSEDIVRGAAGSVKGMLRIESPPGFAHRHIAPHLPIFMNQYPHVSIELTTTDVSHNLVESGLDISIRMKPLSDSDGLAYTELAPNHRQLVASKEYLETNGTPKALSDLADHKLVTLRHTSTGSDWHFKDEHGVMKTFKARGDMVLDSGDAMLRVVLNHGGISMLPRYVTGRHLRNGNLVAVLDDLVMEDFPIHAVTAPTPHQQPKIDSFLKFLLEVYGTVPYWEERDEPMGDAARRASL